MDSNLFVFFFWQSNGKVEKFFCLLYELEMLRELGMLCSFGFDSTRPPKLPGTRRTSPSVFANPSQHRPRDCRLSRQSDRDLTNAGMGAAIGAGLRGTEDFS